MAFLHTNVHMLREQLFLVLAKATLLVSTVQAVGVRGGYGQTK